MPKYSNFDFYKWEMLEFCVGDPCWSGSDTPWPCSYHERRFPGEEVPLRVKGYLNCAKCSEWNRSRIRVLNGWDRLQRWTAAREHIQSRIMDLMREGQSASEEIPELLRRLDSLDNELAWYGDYTLHIREVIHDVAKWEAAERAYRQEQDERIRRWREGPAPQVEEVVG